MAVRIRRALVGLALLLLIAGAVQFSGVLGSHNPCGHDAGTWYPGGSCILNTGGNPVGVVAVEGTCPPEDGPGARCFYWPSR